MPELPEVETVRCGLEEILAHKPLLIKIELRRPDLRFEIPIKKVRSLEGQAILSVGRRAKYLYFETAKGFLISHLGMTGSWRIKTEAEFGTHDHVILHFSEGLSLIYRDPRRFGIFDFSKDLLGEPFSLMGPEPFSEDFSASYLKSKLKGKKVPIKNILMDQRLVVGIGNIYASEILFECAIRPQKASGRVTFLQLEMIVEKTRAVLQKAISAGGSTLQDFAHTNGDSGKFQNEFYVYAKAGEPCRLCGAMIKTRSMAGRSTFWCVRCQH